ncbi:MAG: SGNH/GDSL hydrolase family protein [Bryobacter sp.]|nr:SGNH/GDSL hydrolase family protein [Bryobacter sp. CoA8 C33]
MQHFLVFGDSLSWGIIPGTRRRLPFLERWPGVLETELVSRCFPVRITEDCLNGRRSVFEDPYKPGRNGLLGLAQRIESASPLDRILLMLGTNDFQFNHPFNSAYSSAQGIAALIQEIRRAPIEPGMSIPPITIICPPAPRDDASQPMPKFVNATLRSAGLPAALNQVARDLDCDFFDASLIVKSSPIDGIHLDAPEHLTLGLALANYLLKR